MEADVVQGFEKLVRDYETVQFMEGIKPARVKVLVASVMQPKAV
jgi:hypothetical protein